MDTRLQTLVNSGKVYAHKEQLFVFLEPSCFREYSDIEIVGIQMFENSNYLLLDKGKGLEAEKLDTLTYSCFMSTLERMYKDG